MTTVLMPPAKTIEVAVLVKKILSVRDLLADSSLTIPQYQRPYKWKGKNINQLFSDIATHKGKSPYRLGTIVFHQEGDRNNTIDSVKQHLMMQSRRWDTAAIASHYVAMIEVLLRRLSDGLSSQNTPTQTHV